MTRSLEGRLAKLETSHKPLGGYVVHVCDPPTESELAEIERARIEGHKIAIMPHACRTVDDWVAIYGEGRQAVHVTTGVRRAGRWAQI
jgi:hypothetical protein